MHGGLCKHPRIRTVGHPRGTNHTKIDRTLRADEIKQKFSEGL